MSSASAMQYSRTLLGYKSSFNSCLPIHQTNNSSTIEFFSSLVLYSSTGSPVSPFKMHFSTAAIALVASASTALAFDIGFYGSTGCSGTEWYSTNQQPSDGSCAPIGVKSDGSPAYIRSAKASYDTGNIIVYTTSDCQDEGYILPTDGSCTEDSFGGYSPIVLYWKIA